VFLGGAQRTIGSLRIGEEDGADRCLNNSILISKALQGMGDEEATDVSPGGHITKRRARSRPVSGELIDSVSSATQVDLMQLSQRISY